MSFSDELARLLRLVDGGVGVSAAAAAVGISKGGAYQMLRDAGRGRGPKTTITAEHRRVVVAEYARTGSINRAAIASGLSHSAASRILVTAGRVPEERSPAAKREAKTRFLGLVEQGWSTAGRARGGRSSPHRAGLAQGDPQGRQHAGPCRRDGRGLPDREPILLGHD